MPHAGFYILGRFTYLIMLNPVDLKSQLDICIEAV